MKDYEREAYGRELAGLEQRLKGAQAVGDVELCDYLKGCIHDVRFALGLEKKPAAPYSQPRDRVSVRPSRVK